MCALAKEEMPGSSVGEHKRGAAVLAPQFYVGRLRRVHELLDCWLLGQSKAEHAAGESRSESEAARCLPESPVLVSLAAPGPALHLSITTSRQLPHGAADAASAVVDGALRLFLSRRIVACKPSRMIHVPAGATAGSPVEHRT